MLFVGNISTSNRKHACYSRFLIIYLRPMKTSQLFVPRRTESMVLIFPCTHNLNTKTSSLKIYTPDIPDSRLPQNQSSKAQSYHVSALFLTLKHHTQCKNFPSTVLTSRLSLPPWRTTVISPSSFPAYIDWTIAWHDFFGLAWTSCTFCSRREEWDLVPDLLWFVLDTCVAGSVFCRRHPISCKIIFWNHFVLLKVGHCAVAN